MDSLRPTDHRLTFRSPAPSGYAICMICHRLITRENLGSACPGLAPAAATKEG